MTTYIVSVRLTVGTLGAMGKGFQPEEHRQLMGGVHVFTVHERLICRMVLLAPELCFGRLWFLQTSQKLPRLLYITMTSTR